MTKITKDLIKETIEDMHHRYYLNDPYKPTNVDYDVYLRLIAPGVFVDNHDNPYRTQDYSVLRHLEVVMNLNGDEHKGVNLTTFYVMLHNYNKESDKFYFDFDKED